MQNLSLEQFQPTEAKLRELALEKSKIVITDIEDKQQIKIAHDAKIELRDVRIAISLKGKELRDDANKFSKAVITKEKELLAIIAPEEDRLEKIEENAKEISARKARAKIIPIRQEKLKSIGIVATDEELMEYDDDGFQTFLNAEMEKKLISERQELEAEKAKVEAEKIKIARAKEMEEAKEKTRIETEKRMKEKQALAEKEAKAKAERLEKEKIEAEKKKAEELTKQKEYQEFLAKYGYTEETKDDFILEKTGNMIRLAKILGIFTLFSK